MRETGASGFDSPPSLALEEEFAASEADYSQAAPLPRDAVPAREATAAQTSAHEAGAEPKLGAAAQAPVTAAAPSVGSSAPAEATAPAEPAPAPAKDEPPRPRRNGWWQRARASVIGE